MNSEKKQLTQAEKDEQHRKMMAELPRSLSSVLGCGSSSYRPRVTTAKTPDWKTWQHYPKVKVWQACALALNIDPDSMKRSPHNWMAPESDIFENTSFPSDEHADRFEKLSRLLKANRGNRQHFTQPHDYGAVRLDEFAAWCIHVGFEIPPELSALAKAATQAAPLVEAVPVEQTSPADDHDKILAALFDPVAVETLEKMFPAGGKWKGRAEKAKANGLIIAREGTAMFNPYKAGVWFVTKGADGWDTARLYRTLANNLPARSRDDAHLLTGGIE